MSDKEIWMPGFKPMTLESLGISRLLLAQFVKGN